MYILYEVDLAEGVIDEHLQRRLGRALYIPSQWIVRVVRRSRDQNNLVGFMMAQANMAQRTMRVVILVRDLLHRPNRGFRVSGRHDVIQFPATVG